MNQQLTLQFDEEAGTEDNDFAEKTDVIFQLREKLCDDRNRPAYWHSITTSKCHWFLYSPTWNMKE